MRRVLKISGLNSVCDAEPPPLISRKPKIIIARQHPIMMKFVRVKGIWNFTRGEGSVVWVAEVFMFLSCVIILVIA